jgi:protoheme IX farnesyltransferase
MVRTRIRPIPRESISSKSGCFIGTGLTVASFIAYSQFAPFTWVISNAVWFSYLCIYIPMKRTSSWNTFVGAIVGSLPPLIGTMAQTGSVFSPETALLAGYIFSWQFPHFYGILYENKDDYYRAGFKMLSNDDPKGHSASR